MNLPTRSVRPCKSGAALGRTDVTGGAKRLDRRRLLVSAAGAAVAGMVPEEVAAGAAPRAAAVRPIAMAMHIHASFSEGGASMEAHIHQARQIGVDVIWWTDHDFRQYGLGYRQAVRFDGNGELENGRPVNWEALPAAGLTSWDHAFVTDRHSPDEDGGSLRVEAQAPAGDAWGTYLLQGNAWNFTYSTSYVDTVLTIDVRPGQAGPDGQLVIEVGSSNRPATGGRPAGKYRIQYRIGAAAGRWREEQGLLGVVGVPVVDVERWQRVRMDLQADHDALWPDTVRGDASLKILRVGVRARRGAGVSGYFDRLRFSRRRSTPADGHAAQAAVVRRMRERYPDVTQFPAAEISLVNHLNAFGGDGTLPTYPDASLEKDKSERAQRAMVRFLHRHGAVVSLNHPSIRNLPRKLVETHANGCDLIEVGRSHVELRLPSFDVAARNAVFITATGVSDDHAGEDWLDPDELRWVTTVWAESRARSDLLRSLRAGRAWFSDPLYWRGTLELRLGGQAPMGGVLLTGSRRLGLTVRASRLPQGSRLAVVVGRCDRPGLADLTPRTTTRVVPAADVVDGQWSTSVNRGDGVYARVEVRRADDTLIGFSNPVWGLPRALAGDIPIPAVRRYVDV